MEWALSAVVLIVALIRALKALFVALQSFKLFSHGNTFIGETILCSLCFMNN